MLATSARIATPFYILYVSGLDRHGRQDAGPAVAAPSWAPTPLSNLVWGYLGDKTGFRLVLLFSIAAWIGATVLLMNNHEHWAIFLAFFGLGAAQSRLHDVGPDHDPGVRRPRRPAHAHRRLGDGREHHRHRSAR